MQARHPNAERRSDRRNRDRKIHRLFMARYKSLNLSFELETFGRILFSVRFFISMMRNIKSNDFEEEEAKKKRNKKCK